MASREILMVRDVQPLSPVGVVSRPSTLWLVRAETRGESITRRTMSEMPSAATEFRMKRLLSAFRNFPERTSLASLSCVISTRLTSRLWDSLRFCSSFPQNLVRLRYLFSPLFPRSPFLRAARQ